MESGEGFTVHELALVRDPDWPRRFFAADKVTRLHMFSAASDDLITIREKRRFRREELAAHADMLVDEVRVGYQYRWMGRVIEVLELDRERGWVYVGALFEDGSIAVRSWKDLPLEEKWTKVVEE